MRATGTVPVGAPAVTATSPVPTAVAALRIEARDGHYLAWADNRLAGPIEVMLSAEGGAVTSDPALPARAQVAEGESALVAVFQASVQLRLSLAAVPGDPSARVQDVVYQLPVAAPLAHVEQGFEGSYSHSDEQNRYALDFGVPEGTPVLAARAGRVMQVESRFQQGGSRADSDGPRANFIRIVHDDGTMALYAHLRPRGAMVRMGQSVQAGQPIGRSGNTGFSTGPHLHFAVQVNRGMRLQSIPFRMQALETQ